MYLAKKLKQYRLQKGLTQEEVATRIGVTGQAVGKWEREECYPDISLLPGLSSLFGVTVDELLGMGDINREIMRRKVYEKINSLGSQKKYIEIVEILEEQQKLFPNDFLLDLGIALALSKDNSDRPLRLVEQAKEESMSRSCKYRCTLVAELAIMYKMYGHVERGISTARSLPHFRESRELLIPYLLPKSSRESFLREVLPEIISLISLLINSTTPVNEEILNYLHFGSEIKPFDPVKDLKNILLFLEKNNT